MDLTVSTPPKDHNNDDDDAATVVDVDDNTGDDLFSENHHFRTSGNYSITTSVTIRVTPRQDHVISWAILWGGFVLASLFASWQVYKEYKMLKSRRGRGDDATSVVCTIEQGHGGGVGVVAAGDGGDGVSTADLTRCMFRRLLLLAMITRGIFIPVQIWSDPMWWQFVGDTLPEMVFASAWTLLVSFFVQLVGIATGTGTNTSPGIVIQATAYVVYIVLIATQIRNSVASVLLYALLCCIYAALFGTVVYFCPRLLALLRPSLVRHSGLAVRLLICTVVCILVFLSHTISFARLVVAPPKRVYWWYRYGGLELIPATIFLIIMHPSTQKSTDRAAHLSAEEDPSVISTNNRKVPTLRRSESGSSQSKTTTTATAAAAPPRSSGGGGGAAAPAGETASLLKGSTGGYGSTPSVGESAVVAAAAGGAAPAAAASSATTIPAGAGTGAP